MSDLKTNVWLTGGMRLPHEVMVEVAETLFVLETEAGRKPKGIKLPGELTDLIASSKRAARDQAQEIEVLYTAAMLAHVRLDRAVKWLKLVGIATLVLSLAAARYAINAS